MNKKGFTLIEMLVVILILGIIIVIASYSYTKYINKSREKSFKMAVDSFKDALDSAYGDCYANLSDNVFCSNHSILDIDESHPDLVFLSELVPDYIESIKNPYKSDENCSITSSYITVTSKSIDVKYHGDVVDTEDDNVEYKICLVCGNKRSEGCD